ncbi:hypothetical protein E2C01_036706 [Portunus trituberculatus]|uniref:Uncharacterized protein n=1 Tax=Portunus trituberculatus TaxID=210409 RepID=A0A5B7FCT7_PORTR|nr:hypothetical protein [Portunus trituberculatus]
MYLGPHSTIWEQFLTSDCEKRKVEYRRVKEKVLEKEERCKRRTKEKVLETKSRGEVSGGRVRPPGVSSSPGVSCSTSHGGMLRHSAGGVTEGKVSDWWSFPAMSS